MFALRMRNSIEEMERLEDAGFDPRNFTESVLVERGPFIPDIAENFLLSPQYQLYMRAMNDFAMAQLRKDTGAVINDSVLPDEVAPAEAGEPQVPPGYTPTGKYKDGKMIYQRINEQGVVEYGTF